MRSDLLFFAMEKFISAESYFFKHEERRVLRGVRGTKVPCALHLEYRNSTAVGHGFMNIL